MIRAVIFDLFGTLVETYVNPAAMLDRIGALCGVDAATIDAALWRAIGPADDGTFQSTNEVFRQVGVEVGWTHDDAVADEIVATYLEHQRAAIGRVRADAVEVLTAIRARGLKTGLISNCAVDTVAMWPETPFAPLFDAVVFSCAERLTKPDPRIYRRCCDLLGVAPADCLYVGDGGSRELSGAATVGMRAVLLAAVDTIPTTPDPAHERVSWPGERVETLSGVLPLLP